MSSDIVNLYEVVMFENKSKASFESLHPIFRKRISECSKEDHILVSSSRENY